MVAVKQRIEAGFEVLTRRLYRHPIVTLLATVSFLAFLIYQIPDIEIDTSSEAMLHEKDPSRIAYDQFRDQFGGANMIIIGIQAKQIFSEAFLSRLKALHADIEREVPYIQEVSSLINARYTWGEKDVLHVEELLKGWPEKPVDMDLLRKRVLSNPAYVNHIVSGDGKLAAIVIETVARVTAENPEDELADFETEAEPSPVLGKDNPEPRRYFSQRENQELVEALDKVVKSHDAPDFLLSVTGGPVVVNVFNHYTASDMKLLFLMATGIIVFFLAVLFQRVTGVLLPFIVVYAAMASTLGLMALFHVYITLMSVVLPSFLVAVGIADSVHILSIFYRQYQQGKSKEDAIAYALEHSGLAVVMTSLTTAAGLLSFSYSELSAIGELGIFSAAGVILALIYTIVMLPAMLAVIPVRLKTTHTEARKSVLMDRLLSWFAQFSHRHAGKIVWLCPFLVVFSIFFISQLKLTHSIIKYFPDSFPVKQDALFIDKMMRGMLTIEVVIDTQKENGIQDPDLLQRIDRLSRELESIDQGDIFVGKVFSITDIIKEIHQALNDNQPQYYVIPEGRNTIAQELFLFESSGSDDLEFITDSRFSKTRVTIKIPWSDLVVIDRFVGEIQERFRQAIPPQYTVSITGLTPIMGKTITAAMRSMAESYIIAFVVISILMVLLVGDFKLGMLSMIPNLLPIVTVIGVMGMLRVPMDLTALMIGSIAIGLVVDDTMHFMYNFRKYYELTGDVFAAIRTTLLGTGRAMLFTSIILSSSFFILMVATLRNSVTFGFYTGVVILFALLADFILAPSIMVVLYRRGPEIRGKIKGKKPNCFRRFSF